MVGTESKAEGKVAAWISLTKWKDENFPPAPEVNETRQSLGILLKVMNVTIEG